MKRSVPFAALNVSVLLVCIVLVSGCDRTRSRAADCVQQGATCQEFGQYAEAIEWYRSAIDVNPECEEAYLRMALLYKEQLHDDTNALEACRMYEAVASSQAQGMLLRHYIEGQVSNEPGEERKKIEQIRLDRLRQFEKQELIAQIGREKDTVELDLIVAREHALATAARNDTAGAAPAAAAMTDTGMRKHVEEVTARLTRATNELEQARLALARVREDNERLARQGAAADGQANPGVGTAALLELERRHSELQENFAIELRRRQTVEAMLALLKRQTPVERQDEVVADAPLKAAQ